MLRVEGTARFVSDLHLRPERPDLTGRFLRFIDDSAAAQVAALFILGDLFEYWIGDDDAGSPLNGDVLAALRRFANGGRLLGFLPGNRDFLAGPGFAAASGAQLLGDSATVGAGGTSLLLLHGDTLCTDDQPYQDFRRLVRGAGWQRQFLARPLPERQAEVEKLRARSADAIREKAAAMTLMDANEGAVDDAFAASGCPVMIHGHTHRPGHHRHERGERWVLSDWDDRRGDCLEATADGIRRIAVDR